MFELLALMFAGVIIVGLFFAALVTLKFTLKLALLPLKLLFLPIIAIVFIVKMTVLLALGAAFFGIVIAVLVPLLILGILVAVPIAVIAAIT